jgi:hypothetical protein
MSYSKQLLPTDKRNDPRPVHGWPLRWTLVMMAMLAISTTGCYGLGGSNYNIGLFGFPIPVSPYYQHKQEEKFWKKERYERVPILGPTTSSGPIVALDPPTDDEVMHALESARPVQGGVPLIWEKQRNDVRILKEKISDYHDPPRFYPYRTSIVASCTLQVHDLLRGKDNGRVPSTAYIA